MGRHARDGSLRNGLHGLTVHEGNGTGATTHVQREVVPLVIHIVRLSEHNLLADGLLLRHAAGPLFGHQLTLALLQDELAVAEADAHTVEHREQLGVLVRCHLVAAEPQLHGVVVGSTRTEVADIDLDRLRAVKVCGEVAVVDVPALRRHQHVARARLVVNGRAVTLIHAPVANESRRVGSLRLVTRLIKLGRCLLNVPQRQLVHHALHAVAANGHFAVALKVVGRNILAHKDGTVARGCVDIEHADAIVRVAGVLLPVADTHVRPDVGGKRCFCIIDALGIAHTDGHLSVVMGEE